MKWELVDEESGLERIRIFNGWIVKMQCTMMINVALNNPKLVGSVIRKEQPLNGMLSTCFIPDPNNEWKLEKKIPEVNPNQIPMFDSEKKGG